jgi:hypothetical protein
MSLASAQRALASKNREILQDTASSKIGASLMEGLGEGIAAIGGFIGEKFNVAENVESWENVEAGAEELGISKDNFQKPSLRQKWFKKPTDVLGKDDKTYKVGEDRQITLGNLQHYGALAKSDSRSLYEHLAGGKDKFTGAYTTQLEVPKKASPSTMPLPEHTDGGKAPLYSDYNQIQTRVQEGMDANKVDGKYNFDAARSNYYKQMNEKNKDVENAETISPEAGASYWDELIKKRNELKPIEKPIG